MKKVIKFVKNILLLTLSILMLFSINSCEVIEKKELVSNNIIGKLKVHFIDVDQGDCILVQQGECNMLIDAGTNDAEKKVKEYLTNEKIDKLNYVIGTHAHEDHIGSLDYIINSFNVGQVYFPKQTATTKCFEKFLDACSKNNLKINAPVVGDSFNLGQAICTILSPKKDAYENINDSSIVIKVTFGSTSFIFTGDAGKEAEEEMLSSGLDLKADILKVAHHGSKSATSDEFLKSVDPDYAVISVGKNNDYKLPSKTIMNRLKNKDIPVYRTDESGTIIAVSDGTSIAFNCEAGSYEEGKSSSEVIANYNFESEDAEDNYKEDTNENNNTDEERIVYWTKKGKSYHYDRNCSALKNSKDVMSGKKKECPKEDDCDLCVK